MANVIRIKPFQYIHVLNNNTNVTRVEIGPRVYTRQQHESVVHGPADMVKIPPRHYVVVKNPAMRDEENKPIATEFGNVKLRFGDAEVRLDTWPPFPLYPGEELRGEVTQLNVVADDHALHLRAVRDTVDTDGVQRQSGDEWLFRGPGTHIPRVEITVLELVRPTIISEGQALRLRARRNLTDATGADRVAGEEWLHRAPGAYLPNVDEEIVTMVNAVTLTEKKALRLQAQKTFTDEKGRERKAGSEWLVTVDDYETYIEGVSEKIVAEVPITTLNNRQYCVVLDPQDAEGRNQMGHRELRKGEVSFFLRPGEKLESGIQDVEVLSEEEALLLRARVQFGERRPGEQWLIDGPCDYVPPIEVQIVERRSKIPLDKNEGIYVRDKNTGEVKMVVGRSYMLLPNEELWAKELSATVEKLLQRPTRSGESSFGSALVQRDPTRVVTYRAPHGSAVQVFDYKANKARVIFGPDLVMLQPDEHFTVLSLSGGKPKQSDQIQSLALLLGPDFMTDIVVVETADHARLSLQMAYNWQFEMAEPDTDGPKLFAVPDFVGDACKAIASRVRAAVAAQTFESFHRNSAELISRAVFGVSADGEIKNRLHFVSNNLVITNIDIQNVDPVDQRTRDALQKSVQLAIESTTKSQEAQATHEAEAREQSARGRLEKQRIEDDSNSERERRALLERQAENARVLAIGQSEAEARAQAEAAKIELEASVQEAELQAQATKIRVTSDLEQVKRQHSQEIDHLRSLYEVEIGKQKKMADIEADKFSSLVKALGTDTIKSIARAGPEMQAQLLKGLGLQSTLITDGKSPVNLFNTAKGLIHADPGAGAGGGFGGSDAGSSATF